MEVRKKAMATKEKELLPKEVGGGEEEQRRSGKSGRGKGVDG